MELEKLKRVMPFKPFRRDSKHSDYASKALAMWQKKDLLVRTARDAAAPEQVMVKGSQYIPEVVDVRSSRFAQFNMIPHSFPSG